MKKDTKDKLKTKSIEKLESIKSDLRLQLIVAETKSGKIGANPQKGAKTKLVRDLKKAISRVNTILNQKTQMKDSIERCKSKPYSKRRFWRFKNKMEELKEL